MIKKYAKIVDCMDQAKVIFNLPNKVLYTNTFIYTVSDNTLPLQQVL